MYINNPNKKINFLGNKFVTPEFYLIENDHKNDGRIYKDFYDEADYFARSPVFYNKIKQTKITIAEPPSVSKSKGSSVIMQIVPSAIMSLSSLITAFFAVRKYQSGESDKESIITSVLMCVIFLFTGIFWPFIQHFYEKISDHLSIFKSKRTYKKYLSNKSKSINELRLKDQATLKNIYLSIEECATIIQKRTPYLFSVGFDNERFLSVKLGIGNIPFNAIFEYKRPEFMPENNKLYDDIDKMVTEMKQLNNVPVSLSLKNSNVVAFIKKGLVNKYDYIKTILFQIVTFHSFSDVKIVILTKKDGNYGLASFKKLKHCWDDSMTTRFFATTLNEATDISTYLEKQFLERQKEKPHDKETKDKIAYIIISDSISTYRDLNIIKDILETKDYFGFSLLMFDDKLTNIPKECTKFVEYDNENGSCFANEMESGNIKNFKTNLNYTIDNYVNIDKYCTLLANIPMKIATNKTNNLPSTLGFLEMYGVGNIEMLNCDLKWKQSDVVNTLAAPVGVDANDNLIYLDLHEKRHGPHGLIAGMTGSGKSEFIITYILSLAVNYSPEEVQFVLIDYKGGGLAGAFENRQTGIKLPHLVGTITNLDKSEMNRTLASIQSELQRRQRKFNEVKEKMNTGTIDIYKYQKLYREGKISDPMSHLFIISDEFAELKSQQPDFMDQLVSAARIGRSLGVHLILATQKPSGVVDDQIWSNSKFKVCCKVQTAEDSSEMLGKTDAAYLKDSGRFYLQVGYDIYYILGQSAYSGLKYIPSEKIKTNVDNSLVALNDTGEIIKTINDKDNEKKDVEQKDLGEELSNILKYIIDVASKNNYKINQLWLDNIPNEIFLESIKNKYINDIVLEKGILNPTIGEYDNPEAQSQGVVTLPITTDGNCFVGGVSGSGKSTFLSTLILSTIISHSTNEVNFYIIDFANEKLKKFDRAPQVGNVLTMDNNDKVMILLNRIKMEMKTRKKILSKADADYLSYVKNDIKPYLPNYIVIINGFDSFKEQYSDFIDDNFMSIIRESNKYGITFIVAATDLNAMYSSQLEQFPQKILFKFNDDDAYLDTFGTNLIPADNPGRGLIKIHGEVYQFQTAKILPDENINDALKCVFEKLSKIMPKADQIPIMPDFVNADCFNNTEVSLSRVPIGYNIDTIQPSLYNFENHISLILGSKEKNLLYFINSLSGVITSISKLKVLVLDGNKKFTSIDRKNIKYYDSDFSKLIEFLYNNLKKFNKNTENRIIVFISGYEKIEQHLKEFFGEDIKEKITLEKLIYESNDHDMMKFIICGTYDNGLLFENEEWYSYLSKKNGILISSDFDGQEFIAAKRDPNEFNLSLDETNAIVVRNSVKEFITYISE